MRRVGLLPLLCVVATLCGCDAVFGLAVVHRGDAGVHHKPIDAADVDADSADAGPPPTSCLDALHQGVTTDGVVTIDPGGSGAPYDVYCDMTTGGGGWTLVWVYGFTNYNGFTNSNNAVTPHPSWGYPTGNATPVSTVIPTSPSTPGAMDFPKWLDIGSEFLVTSTINHWVQCTPGNGSLVTLTQGSVSCQIAKVVATACTTTVPNTLNTFSAGPGLTVGGGTNNYYFFDGSVGTNWPTHDPCGHNQANQLTGVENPGGAVYVR